MSQQSACSDKPKVDEQGDVAAAPSPYHSISSGSLGVRAPVLPASSPEETVACAETRVVASVVPPCQSTSASSSEVPTPFLPPASPEETAACVGTCVDSPGVERLRRAQQTSAEEAVDCVDMRAEPQCSREGQRAKLKPLFVELCAGTARLSSAVTRRNVDAMAIDISSARSSNLLR